jgi:hypothetical protein
MADKKVGIKTGKQTQAGRDVYVTPEGENVSEKSTTFKYKGMWINVPSIYKGQQYDDDTLKLMLEAEIIKPTSTHKNKKAAEKAAQERSKTLEFNQGGDVSAQMDSILPKKGMGYGELIVDNILGLDNEYESFGEKLGKVIDEDELKFLKDAAVGVYEGAKEFITSPVETTKEVVTNIKDSVQRLGSEDLDTRLQNMYGVSYDQATDQQVNSAREAVIGDAMTALELIPAAKAATVTAKAASSAVPSGVKADIVGQTKAVFGGDMEFLRGTPTERSGTVGVGAQRADKPTLQFETSSGSTYDQFKNATTIRNRAERDDNEVSGVQPRSGKTVFMNKESIDTIGPLFQNTEIPVQFIPLEGNKAKLIYTKDYGPKKAGEDASNIVQFTTSPRMGLHPVEIMDSKNTDRRNIHFGNEIVKIRSASKKDKETKKEPKVSFAPLVRPNEKKTAAAEAMDIHEAAAINQRSTSPEEIKKIRDMDITKLESSDFYSSILPGVASLDIPEGGIKGSKVKDFLEKDNNISNTQLYWSGLLNEIDSDTIYNKDTLVNLARQNIPKIEVITNTGSAGARYRDLQRIPLVEDSSTDKFVTKQSLPVPAHIRFEGQPGAQKAYYKELIAINKNPKGNFYQAAESHWGYGGTAVAHTRLSEYTHNGNKFAVVEELQSDMAQVATDDRNKNLEVATKENSTDEIPLTAGDISDSLTNSSSDLVSSFYIGEAPEDFKFTNRFEKELENISQTFYNKSFNDLASGQEFIEVSETVLSDLMFQFANLKFKYENNEIDINEVIQKITTNMPGITEKVLTKGTYNNLVSTPIDKIFSNAFSDYVFGKSTIKNNPDLKYKIADLFDTAPSISDFKKANLSMLKQSEATRVSLLMAIKDAKKNNINKIYVVPPKTAAYYHSFSEDTADKIYNSTLNKVLKTLSTETNNAVKYQRKNPEGIRFPISKPIGRAGSWEFDDDQIAMEIDITDFDLPDNPQFRFAEGGVVKDMDNQMKMALMQEGGLQDDGMSQDPVSGNEIPNGSMASEVRDDIPAQLSEGEYVVPADVVRFFGVKFFEDLRSEAKMGLQQMNKDGRIGGEPVAVTAIMGAAPISDAELDQLIQQELSQEAKPAMAMGGLMADQQPTMQQQPMMQPQQPMMQPQPNPYQQQQQMMYNKPTINMNKGGFISTSMESLRAGYAPGGSVTGFDPSKYSYGGTGSGMGSGLKVVQYVNDAGSIRWYSFIDGKIQPPGTKIPAGYKPSDPSLNAPLPETPVTPKPDVGITPPDSGGRDDNYDSIRGNVGGSSDGEEQPLELELADRLSGVDFDGDLLEQAKSFIEDNQGQELSKLGGFGALLGGPGAIIGGVMGVAGKVQELKGISSARALALVVEARGGEKNKKIANSINDFVDGHVKARGGLIDFADGFAAAGTMTADSFARNLGFDSLEDAIKNQDKYNKTFSKDTVRFGSDTKYSDQVKGKSNFELAERKLEQQKRLKNVAGLEDAKKIIGSQGDDGPSAAQIAAAQAKGDRIDKEQRESIISSGNTYSSDPKEAIKEMKDEGTFNVGGRAKGGLMLKKKNK